MMWRGKINKIRTIGMLMIFLGFVIMYVALLFQKIPVLMYIVMMLGFLSVLGSVGVYFWVGLLSTKSVQVKCPRCERVTKVLGSTDECSFCGTTLSFDSKYAKEKSQNEEKSDPS